MVVWEKQKLNEVDFEELAEHSQHLAKQLKGVKASRVKQITSLLHHAILVLCKGCNTSLTRIIFKPCFDTFCSCLP